MSVWSFPTSGGTSMSGRGREGAAGGRFGSAEGRDGL